LEDLDRIHRKMETELGKHGAYIDDIFFCPHHPDKGFPGEKPEYKIECDCRKPKPGLIIKAAEKYNIDIPSSYMIGDDPRDVRAGIAAGCKTALLRQQSGEFPAKLPAENEIIDGETVPVQRDLKAFTENLLQGAL